MGASVFPAIRFFVKISKLGVPYLYEFTKDSNETSHIYKMWYDKSSGAVYLLLNKKFGMA